ncbi:MAG: glycosyltransferase family 4 protein [Patescibacteria group bacterium]
MRVVFLSGLYPPRAKGGGEISTYLIAEELKKMAHQVQVITGKEIPGLLEKPLFERRHALRMAVMLKKILPEADIIHAHDFRSALALSELNLPNAVVTVRDYAPICGTTNNVLADGRRCHCTWHDVLRTKRFQEVGFPRNWARAWQYWYNTPYRRQAYRKLKHQIFISRAQQREIAEQFDFSGIETTVIYNPVPFEHMSFPPWPESLFDFNEVMVPPKDRRVQDILYVGRLEDYKGVQVLLEAWEEVAKELPDARLKLIGEGAQENDYKRWTKRRGLQKQVTFLSRMSHEKLMEEYGKVQIVVAPHIWTEPFGRTVVEAMGRSKVVVAADVGGPAEIIRNGETGILFERGSVSSLAAALRHVLQMSLDDREDIGLAAVKWIGEHVSSWEAYQQHKRFYEKILSKT